MVKSKLFKLQHASSGTHWCFAPNAKMAKNIVSVSIHATPSDLTADDVTQEHIAEDGVQFLIDRGFTGIPQKSVFMLTGSMSHSVEHFIQKQRTPVLWWSETIPESRQIWK